ncbi:MAG TPA: hypothetical protein VGD95_08745, partial [Micavibrio sp.]
PALPPERYRVFVADYQQQLRAVLDENKQHPFRYFFPLTTQNTWQSAFYQGAESYARLQLLKDGAVYFTSPAWFLWVADHCEVQVTARDLRAAHRDLRRDAHLTALRELRTRLSGIKFALSHFSWPRTVPQGLRYCLYSVWTHSGFRKWQEERQEPFYGPLPRALDHALVVYHREGGWAGRLAPDSAFKIARNSQFLRWRDWGALMITLLFFKLRLPQGVEMPVAALRQDYSSTLANQFVLALLAYYSARYIARRNPAVKFITLFEGNCWEQGILASAGAQGRKVIGVQHTAFAPAFLKMQADGQRPVPDRIVTTGAIPAQLLATLMGHDPEKIYPACQLRGGFTYHPRMDSAGQNILVLLQGGPYDQILLQRIRDAQLDRHIVVRPHPGQEPGPLSGLMVADGKLQDHLQQASVVIYNGTTACFDALAAGVPCIYMCCGDAGRNDPLVTLVADIKRNCHEGDDLAMLLRAIESLPLDAYLSACAQCHQYIKEYFHPVDASRLNALKEFIEHV